MYEMIAVELGAHGEIFVQSCRLICIRNKQHAGDSVLTIGLGFFRVQKNLGRTKTRTRDRICFQTIRSVRDISRDDLARIATCSLITPTDIYKENYSRRTALNTSRTKTMPPSSIDPSNWHYEVIRDKQDCSTVKTTVNGYGWITVHA